MPESLLYYNYNVKIR